MNPRQYTVVLLEFTRKTSNDLVKNIPDDKLTFQPSPTDNHPLWVMGHLAGTDAWMAGILNIPNMNVPESVLKTFAYGSKPTSTGNPSAADTRKAFDSSRAALMSWFREAPESALTADLKEKSNGFATDAIDAMLKLAWHEGWHMGQVANVRKALSLPNVFG